MMTERRTKLYDGFFVHVHLHHIHKCFLYRAIRSPITRLSHLSYLSPRPCYSKILEKKQRNLTTSINFFYSMASRSFYIETQLTCMFHDVAAGWICSLKLQLLGQGRPQAPSYNWVKELINCGYQPNVWFDSGKRPMFRASHVF